jgi:murein DD-endopeptidase MepM/ murein hydrolase activator NlpD
MGKRQYLAREQVILHVDNATPSDLTVTVVGPKKNVSIPTDRLRVENGTDLVLTAPADFAPGKYTVAVTDPLGTKVSEDFLWGVLAINTNKSVYSPHENASIAIAVLDDGGRMVCDAVVTLTIVGPSSVSTTISTKDGTITVNKGCTRHDVSIEPDYETTYVTGDSGTYALTLSATTKNGTNTMSDAFEVKTDVPFDVERISPTRIYPPNTYPVRIPITAHRDFTGRIVESVPEDFTITSLDGVLAYTDTAIATPSASVHMRPPFDGEFPVTQGFGEHKDDYTKFGLVGHDGIDFALPEGTAVLAADSGAVALAGDGAYGTTIVIDHSWGRSYYGHLESTQVVRGQRIQMGEQIGLSGHTGEAEGPHLHFGIKPRKVNMDNGYFGKIDPEPFLSRGIAQSDVTRKEIVWNVTMKKGESVTLGYQFKAPPKSPELYLLGPLKFETPPYGISGITEPIEQATPSVEFMNEASPSGDIQGAQTQQGAVVFAESRQWQIAADATFSMQTGYYIGDGSDNRAITGIGFQPSMVLIKGDTAGTNGMLWKSTSMSGEVTALLGVAGADIATDAIQSLDSNGFTLGTNADVNGLNIRFTWEAFGGSDCTSSGTFCVGSYTGDGTATHAINTVGFQPNMVTVKRSGTSIAVFRTSSMPTNDGQIFDSNESTDGSRFKTLDSTGFTVGANGQVNTNGNTYWYFAFKTTANAFAVGSYTGDGTDNRGITGVGFKPNLVWDKLANGTAAKIVVFNLTESNGDYSGRPNANANFADMIQSLDSDGFTIGTLVNVNENLKTFYWIAFAGATNPTASGTYQMKVGTYTGNGSAQSIGSMGFSPDLVIIKDQAGANYAVFRTKLMKGDFTAYFTNTAVNFAGGITSMDSDGFSVGAGVTVNTNATVYTYQAFGNAFNPEKNTGAADFTIGSYTGSFIDNRNILRLPFQPDLVAIKTNSTNKGVWRSSSFSGDLTVAFDGGENANQIQALNSDGFQLGTAGTVSSDGNTNFFFAFKASGTMAVNNYTGTGSAQNITTVGFNPDLVWVSTVFRPSTVVGDSTLRFPASAALTDRITGMVSNGFSIGGNQSQTNTNGTVYRYATWKIPVSGPTLDQLMRHGNWFNTSGVEQSFTF